MKPTKEQTSSEEHGTDFRPPRAIMIHMCLTLVVALPMFAAAYFGDYLFLNDRLLPFWLFCCLSLLFALTAMHQLRTKSYMPWDAKCVPMHKEMAPRRFWLTTSLYFLMSGCFLTYSLWMLLRRWP